MTTVGIICEYDPFHNGHARQFRLLRERFGEDCRTVCLMSGNFVQRGEPAIFGKYDRARAAVACGADVVLELPVIYALSSAEGFASGGVKILSELGVEYLCFGCETDDSNLIISTAKALLLPQMDEKIKAALQTGISYAAAREQALSEIFPQGASVLHQPNDILAVEYCKAILRQNSPMQPLPILRTGDYHGVQADPDAPSATAVRGLLAEGRDISPFVPAAALAVFENAKCYSLAVGERAMLARLHTMTEEDYSRIPFGSEGLWRRFFHACRNSQSTQEIIDATKTKRYARTRIRRMLMCAVLGLTEEDLRRPLEYVRILSFSEQGRQVLRSFKTCSLPLISAEERVRNSEFYEIECRCKRMFSLFLR